MYFFIDSDSLINSFDSGKNSSLKTVSILRMKGFWPNKMLDVILENYLK